jgi:hypothetical protein
VAPPQVAPSSASLDDYGASYTTVSYRNKNRSDNRRRDGSAHSGGSSRSTKPRNSKSQ